MTENILPFSNPNTRKQRQHSSAKLSPIEGLTIMQENFCQELAKSNDLNVANAARRAGYSEYYSKKRAYTLLENQKIRTRIQQIQREAFEKAGTSPQDVLRRITKIATSAEAEDDYSAALRALELLGKHFALFSEKRIHENREDSFKTGATNEDRHRDISNLLRVVPAERLQKLKDGTKDGE